jgi:hypothetical protein
MLRNYMGFLIITPELCSYAQNLTKLNYAYIYNFSPVLDWTVVPTLWTIQSSLFYSLHFQAWDRTIELGLDHIFHTGLRSQFSGPCGPALSDGLQKKL